MARYTRDEILIQGIELSSSPTVIQHDMPGGIIQPNAYSIKWLQNALDMFHNKYPFSTDVTEVTVNFNTGTNDLVLNSDNTTFLPSSFILDVRDGVLYTQSNKQQRLKRLSFQYWLSYNLSNQNTQTTVPRTYTKVNSRIKFSPKVTVALTGSLWYYAQPSEIPYNGYPSFPDEHTLIEFIRLKSLEWTRSIEVGTAVAFMTKELVRLRMDGLIDDSEYDVPPIENNQVFIDSNVNDRNSWMYNR